MADLEWFDEYSGQTTDELIALEGKYRTDSLVVAFQQALDQKEMRPGAEKLADEERVIQAVEALEMEVNNGGYGQFFINSSYEYTPIIVDALNRIGRPDVAALTQDAIDILGIDGPLTLEAVEAAMVADDEDRDDKLNECDNRYYQTAGDLATPLFEFIKRNRDKIALKG